MVSLFGNNSVYWPSMELRKQYHDFVASMTAVVLGKLHPITLVLNLMKDLHHYDLFTLSWQRVIDLFGARLGTDHRVTIQAAEAFSSTLIPPSSSRWPWIHGRCRVELPGDWNREDVYYALEHLSHRLQRLQSDVLNMNPEDRFWPQSLISESKRLIQAILAADEAVMDRGQQWLRHDTELRLLIVCYLMYRRLANETRYGRQFSRRAFPLGDHPKVAFYRCVWIQSVFTDLHRTWYEIGREEEAERLEAIYPVVFGIVPTCRG